VCGLAHAKRHAMQCVCGCWLLPVYALAARSTSGGLGAVAATGGAVAVALRIVCVP
jgi:hypothetical protein